MFLPEGTYQMSHTVDFYECDLGLRIRPSALLRQLQQAGENQLIGLGVDYETLRDKYSMGFLTSKLIMEIDRMPENNEEIGIKTCPMGIGGSQFFRQTDAMDRDGNSIVRLYTSWTLYDPNAHKILRPREFPIEFQCGTLDIDPKSFRLRVPQGEPMGQRPVVYSDLDSNGHMNNAVYLDVLCDMLPLEKLKKGSPSRIHLAYDHQAVPGEPLSLYRSVTEKGTYVLSARQQEHLCFEAEVAFPPEI